MRVCELTRIVDHFHVHIVNASFYGIMGSTVGQAHLLDDIISLVCHVAAKMLAPAYDTFQLELDPDSYDGPSIFERLTLTYGLGSQHGLYESMRQAQKEIDD